MDIPEIINFGSSVFSAFAASIAFASIAFFFASAVKSKNLRRILFDGFDADKGLISPSDYIDDLSELPQRNVSRSEPPAEREIVNFQVKKVAFEKAALENYYNQALSRANISFWFSLLFASIGFGVIIFAFLTHSSGGIADTAIKVVSGTVIDGVSALFFVQSTNAQKSMSEFFEKLRLDRLNVEAREMIAEIENAERRDQLRAQLVIKYSGIEKLIVSS